MKSRSKILIAALVSTAVGVAAIPTLAASASDPEKASSEQGMKKPGKQMADRGERGHGPRHGDRDGRRGQQARGGHGDGPRGGQSLASLVERFDVNDDGTITKEEVVSVNTERLQSYDANNDGSLSLAEFTALWTDTMKERIVRAFQQRDPDGDALVTLEEYSAPFDKAFARLDRNDDGSVNDQDRQRPQRGPQGGPGGPQGGPPADAPANPPAQNN